MNKETKVAVEFCENILREYKKVCVDNRINPSVVRVIDKLLTRRNELSEVYVELYSKYPDERVIHTFMDCALLSIFWNHQRSKEMREEEKKLVELNQKIAKTATKLGELLRKRRELTEYSAFHSDTVSHICDLIEKAAINNHMYRMYVDEKLSVLASQYDSKYWPHIDEIIGMLAIDAQNATIVAASHSTEIATNSSRPSKADFLKAFFVRLEKCFPRSGGQLPENFKLTDRSYAAIVNCVLDLDPDEMVDAAYVKRARQQMRDR